MSIPEQASGAASAPYPEVTVPAAHPPPVCDAATVVLLRDGACGPEAFTLTRATTMAFSAGATVSPGARVDPRDDLPEQFCMGADLDPWVPVLGLDPGPGPPAAGSGHSRDLRGVWGAVGSAQLRLDACRSP